MYINALGPQAVLLDGALESFIQLLGGLVIFAFVIAVTYLTTKWMGAFQKANTHNKNLRVVEAIGVGNNKSICIVEAGTKYLVVAVGKENVTMLCELTETEFKDRSVLEETKSKPADSFKDIMTRISDRIPKK